MALVRLMYRTDHSMYSPSEVRWRSATRQMPQLGPVKGLWIRGRMECPLHIVSLGQSRSPVILQAT